MKAAPQLGAKTGGATGPGQGPRGPGGGGGGPRGFGSAPAKPAAPQSLNNDWFSAALNKKR
jgi:uncharacterized protein